MFCDLLSFFFIRNPAAGAKKSNFFQEILNK